MAIHVSQIPTELLSACPEFQQKWDNYMSWMARPGMSRTTGTDALYFAMFLDGSYRSKQTHLFPRFFDCIERLLMNGEPETRKATDEILEQIRMSLVTRMNGAELYASWMSAETKRHWDQVGEDVVAKNPKYANKPRPRICPERLREYRVTLTKCEPWESALPPDHRETMDLGTATKLGGDPDWVQSDNRPKCPCCNQGMTFVAQIDSIEHIGLQAHVDVQTRTTLRREQQWMFGDVGMIYVFFCFYCLETSSVFQCG